MPPAAGCCRGFFCLIGKFFDFPIRQKNPSGRIALRRKGIMLRKATRRRRRILQSRILFQRSMGGSYGRDKKNHTGNTQ